MGRRRSISCSAERDRFHVRTQRHMRFHLFVVIIVILLSIPL